MVERKWKIDGAACFLWALLLLTVPLRWLGAIALAALMHELGHILTVLLFGGRMTQIQIRMDGACISAQCPTVFAAVLCTLAGPAASLMLVFCCRWLPRTAVCALIQFAYNMLPIYPLDGGRCLRLLTQSAGRKGERVFAAVEETAIGLLCLGGFCAVFVLRLGILPLLCLFFLWYVRKKDLAKPFAR